MVAQASTGPASTWAMLYWLANVDGIDLEVDLEAGVARLDHHRVVAHPELVDPLDVEVDLVPAQVADGLVELSVALAVDHVRQAEVRLADRRQDPGEQHLDAPRVRRRPAAGRATS